MSLLIKINRKQKMRRVSKKSQNNIAIEDLEKEVLRMTEKINSLQWAKYVVDFVSKIDLPTSIQPSLVPWAQNKITHSWLRPAISNEAKIICFRSVPNASLSYLHKRTIIVFCHSWQSDPSYQWWIRESDKWYSIVIYDSRVAMTK